MKYIISILLLTLSLSASAQVKVSQLPAASTLTGAELVPVTQSGVSKKATTASIASVGADIIVTGLGTTSGDATANATAATVAQALALYTNKGLVLPGGDIYWTSLRWNGITRIRGAGRRKTRLIGTAAAPLIWANGSSIIIAEDAEGISDLTLDGNNVATYGLNLELMAWFKIQNIAVTHCTIAGVLQTGVLTASMDHCVIGGNPIGLKSNPVDTGALAQVDGNLMTITDCVFGGGGYGGATYYAVDWNGGALVELYRCDFEVNGSQGLDTTGAIRARNMNPDQTKGGIAIRLNGCWFERNYGTVVDFQNPINPCKYVIESCTFGCSPNVTTMLKTFGVNNTTISTNNRQYSVYPYCGSSNNPDVWVGDNATVIHQNSDVAWVQETNGGVYIDDVKSLYERPVGNGGSTYTAEVTASSPIYYNRLNGSSSPLTPSIGTGNITATGNVGFQKQTPFLNDASAGSVLLQDDQAVLTVPVSLGGGSYTSYAIEFWAYVSPLRHYTLSTQSLIMNGGGTWGSTVGSWAFAENQVNNTYVGIVGNSGLKDDATVPKVKYEGWYHFVLFISNGGFTKVMRNGVSIWTGTTNASSNNLVNGNIAWNFGYRICDFALYAGTIPTEADFKRHYRARNN